MSHHFSQSPTAISQLAAMAHVQITLAVLLALLACTLASNVPQAHPLKLAATINIIAAPNTGDGTVNCIKIPAALCQRTEAACTTDAQPDGACCNKDFCIVLDSDIFADAKCANYGACCPGAA